MYKPRLKGNKEDTSCFDTHFTKQKPQDSHVDKPLLKPGQDDDGFKGFTFAPNEKGILNNNTSNNLEVDFGN